MQFRKVSSNKYIALNGYTLIQCTSGSYSIYRNGKLVPWGAGFKTVKAAELSLSGHSNCIQCTTDKGNLISPDDLEFIHDMYCIDIDGDKWIIDSNHYIVPRFNRNSNITVTFYENNIPKETYQYVDSLLQRLDDISGEDVFASVMYRGIAFRQIFASNKHKSSKNFAKDLIRVKSSNVWAYGVEMKDNNPKVGDIYVQFKGKNGGPGDVYRYYDVPVNVWRKFITYPSKGSYVYHALRNKFQYSKLTGDKKGKLPNAIN